MRATVCTMFGISLLHNLDFRDCEGLNADGMREYRVAGIDSVMLIARRLRVDARCECLLITARRRQTLVYLRRQRVQLSYSATQAGLVTSCRVYNMEANSSWRYPYIVWEFVRIDGQVALPRNERKWSDYVRSSKLELPVQVHVSYKLLA